jgi:streptogramin lyase
MNDFSSPQASLSLCASVRVSMVSLMAAVLLTGCATSVSFPDAGTTTAAQSSLGTIQGNNYGGHAPLVGAHVFLLQAATNGYGGAATSLLQAGETATDFYGSTYSTMKDTTPGSPTNGDYYVVTDSRGDFNLSNGYTCTAGLPVYIYAQGGNPQTAPPTVTVTGASVASNGAGGYTVTLTAPNLLYQGESVVFTGSGDANSFGAYINGATLNVLSDSNLTTTTFDITVGSLTHNGVTLTTGSQTDFGTVTAAESVSPATNNPAVVNLAVLGICPSNGTQNFNSLPFVYVNEVSTAAAAYALAGFFPAPGTAGLANTGAVAANLSIPASDSLALEGLQTAALTAAQLYDIGGSNIGGGGDGDTHIARTTTVGVPLTATTTAGSATVAVSTTVGLQAGTTITGSTLPAGETISALGANSVILSTGTGVTAGTNVRLYAGTGNGVVPQALLNTIGNILANCVDSANTYSPYTTTGTASTQCSQLFGYTTSNGVIASGTAPVDTASAAIDMAHNPWANVTLLVDLPTGTVPFQPTLASANDFSVGIEYVPANIGYPQGIAVDGPGNVWYTNFLSGYVTALTPLGGVLYNVQPSIGDFLGYISIDPFGAAWYTDLYTGSLRKISAAGTYVGAYDSGGLNQPFGVGSDGTGHIYVEDIGGPTVYDFTNAGTLTTTPANPLAGASSCALGIYHADHLATDNAANGYNLWYTSELGDFVCEVNTSTGALIRSIQISAGQGIGATYSPEFIGIDANGTAWIPNQQHASMSRITQAGVLTDLTSGTLSGAFGSAVDGAGNIFVTNRTTNNITEYLGSTSAAVSTVNFQGGGNATVMNDPLNVAIDPSGNLWIANYAGSRIVELVGIAAPTYTPLSAAAGLNKLGSKP